MSIGDSNDKCAGLIGFYACQNYIKGEVARVELTLFNNFLAKC